MSYSPSILSPSSPSGYFSAVEEFSPQFEDHHAALERKFNNYDYQDLSDVKLSSSRSAKIRASISGAATIKSTRSSRTTKSAKIHREISRPQNSNPRRYSASTLSPSPNLIDTMSINMHSVALSSVHQKHMHVGPIESQKIQTNYDKQKVRMHTEKQALGPTSSSRHKSSSHHQHSNDRIGYDRNAYDRSAHDRNAYERSMYERSVRDGRSVRSVSSNKSSEKRVRHKQSGTSVRSNRTRRHNGQHRHSTSLEDGQVYLIGKDSCVSLHDDESVHEEASLFDKRRYPEEWTPATSPECSPLNKPGSSDENYHLSRILEVSTPKDASFARPEMHRNISHVSRISSERHVRSKNSKISISAPPKAVFSLEDTLRADQNLSSPTNEELKMSVQSNLTKPAPAKRNKKNSGSFWSNLFASLFGKKSKSIDKRNIEVINQRIGVY